MMLCVRDAGMPRKDFIATFPKNETNIKWLDKHIRAQAQALVARWRSPRDEIERRRRSWPTLEETRAPDDRDIKEINREVSVGEAQGAPRQEGNGRGEPASRDFDREEVHEPRPAVPRPDPGRQHRPDEGGRQVRIPPRLQVLDVCDVVDSPGDHALDRRPGAHHPYPGAHDRDHQQAEPHLAADAAGDGPRADAGRAGACAWRCRRTRSARCSRSPRSPSRWRLRSATTRIRTWATSSRTRRWPRRSTRRRWKACARPRTPYSPA